MKKKSGSIYDVLGSKIKEGIRHLRSSEKININETIRTLRLEKKLSGVELCKRAGDMDPRTLTALEKGRIKNPSIKTLQSVARGLGVTVSDLFRQSEVGIDRNFHLGTQKGVYQIDYPSWGIKIVSFTPFVRDFFCGKIILAPRKKLNQTLLRHAQPIYVSVLVGRVEISVEDRRHLLKEGENLFFNGILNHTFSNAVERESSLLIMTSPSFI
jgi:transcriptional regulator with XRE-family HTH domain